MELKNREDVAQVIVQKITQNKSLLKKQYELSKHGIGYFYIDNLLPEPLVKALNDNFPEAKEMVLKKSLRENKLVSAQMDKHYFLLEEVLYAFQDKRIVSLIKEITGIHQLYPDQHLYAGGISTMKQHQFLNPHLDNSHDKDRNNWRVLNLLFYVTPNWKLENGGHLELWPKWPKKSSVLIESRFNRLVVMATHNNSWHSVSPVILEGSRNCISNYYFSDSPLLENDRFHVTTFRGRPHQILTNQILKLDSFLRSIIRKVFKKGIRENSHVYKK